MTDYPFLHSIKSVIMLIGHRGDLVLDRLLQEAEDTLDLRHKL